MHKLRRILIKTNSRRSFNNIKKKKIKYQKWTKKKILSIKWKELY